MVSPGGSAVLLISAARGSLLHLTMCRDSHCGPGKAAQEPPLPETENTSCFKLGLSVHGNLTIKNCAVMQENERDVEI